MQELEELARLDTEEDDSDFDPEGLLGDSDDYQMDDEEEEIEMEEAEGAGEDEDDEDDEGGASGGGGTLRIGVDRTLACSPFPPREHAHPPLHTQPQPEWSTSSTPLATLAD
jgi:hypothetical protein